MFSLGKFENPTPQDENNESNVEQMDSDVEEMAELFEGEKESIISMLRKDSEVVLLPYYQMCDKLAGKEVLPDMDAYREKLKEKGKHMQVIGLVNELAYGAGVAGVRDLLYQGAQLTEKLSGKLGEKGAEASKRFEEAKKYRT